MAFITCRAEQYTKVSFNSPIFAYLQGYLFDILLSVDLSKVEGTEGLFLMRAYLYLFPYNELIPTDENKTEIDLVGVGITCIFPHALFPIRSREYL